MAFRFQRDCGLPFALVARHDDAFRSRVIAKQLRVHGVRNMIFLIFRLLSWVLLQGRLTAGVPTVVRRPWWLIITTSFIKGGRSSFFQVGEFQVTAS